MTANRSGTPLSWRADQEEVWQICRSGRPPVPSGDQTAGQAFEMAVEGFMRACDFDGVPPPARELVAERFRTEFPLAT